MISDEKELENLKNIDWNSVDQILNEEREKSIKFLMELTQENENS